MPNLQGVLTEVFSERAESVGATVCRRGDMDAAIDYALDVCARKEPAEILVDEPGAELGAPGPNGMPTRRRKIMAAPALDAGSYGLLAARCAERGFLCLRGGMRNHTGGIDVCISPALLGIAASGTCMLDSDGEDARLASTLCETGIIILPIRQIYTDLPSIADMLRTRMSSHPGTFTTFVTGPSRTSDIERVPATGVHGPLELHIILLGETGHA